jgi:hypothetical protein
VRGLAEVTKQFKIKTLKLVSHQPTVGSHQ